MEKKETDYLKKVGRRIVKERMNKDSSQDSLALEADISRRTIFRLEGGDINPKILTLKKVAKAPKIKLSDLVQEK